MPLNGLERVPYNKLMHLIAKHEEYFDMQYTPEEIPEDPKPRKNASSKQYVNRKHLMISKRSM